MRWLLLFLASTVSAANLVPNSSFECGPGRGWMYFGGNDNKGDSSAISGCLSTTNFHGTVSFEVQSRLISRSIWLNAGDYTVSAYIRAPSSLSVQFGLMDAGRLDQTPGNAVTATNGWQRFSHTRTITTNGFYNFKVYHISSTVFPLVDAVQVEAGTSLSAYAPLCNVEMGLDTSDPDNLLLSADAKQFRMRFWNDGTASTNTGQYMIYDFLNNIIGSNSFSQVLPAVTNTTVVVNLSASNGWMRLTSRLYEFNDSWDETEIAVLPYAVNMAVDTNSFLGTHPPYFAYHLNRERRSGYGFARDLSPAACARWGTIETSRGVFAWNDVAFSNFVNSGMTPVCNLFPGVSPTWPVWATNGDGTADWIAYSNFCYVTVARYSASPYNVHYWETINEPNTFGGTGFPVLTNAAILAMVITNTVQAITLADPSAYVIALGGMAHAADGWDVWTNLPTYIQNKISAVSCHVYPQDNGTTAGNDPNLSESDVHFTSMMDWWLYFGTVKPIWNTESGTFGSGGYKTINSLLQGNYSLWSAPALEASRIEIQARAQYSIDRQIYAVLRSLGWGFKVYVNYWSKHFNDQMVDLSPTDPTTLEFNSATKPNEVAVLMTKYLAGIGLGHVTNANATSMDIFVFTNSLGTSLACWNWDRTFKTITTTNANIALYDCMGNQLQTNSTSILITRTPRYLVSGSLTTAQLSNTVKYASVAAYTDTNAPKLSFDVAPSGAWDGTPMLTLAKWTAFDENKIIYAPNGVDPATNVVYKWHLDSDSYTALSASNHAWLPTMANGNHTLYVTAQDSLGNNAEYSYAFSNNVTAPPSAWTNVTLRGRLILGGKVNK